MARHCFLILSTEPKCEPLITLFNLGKNQKSHLSEIICTVSLRSLLIKTFTRLMFLFVQVDDDHSNLDSSSATSRPLANRLWHLNIRDRDILLSP